MCMPRHHYRFSSALLICWKVDFKLRESLPVFMLTDSQRVHVQRQQYKYCINLLEIFEDKPSAFVVEFERGFSP